MLPTLSSLPSSVVQRLHQITGGGGHTVLLTGIHFRLLMGSYLVILLVSLATPLQSQTCIPSSSIIGSPVFFPGKILNTLVYYLYIALHNCICITSVIAFYFLSTAHILSISMLPHLCSNDIHRRSCVTVV